MRGWKDLGVVDTIYEEEHEEASNSSSSLTTPSPSPTPTPPHSSTSTPTSSLHATVQEWSEATGCKTDVVIRVQDQNFHLHKQPLISRSGYLRRQLTESADVTVSPPWNVTADTFTAVAQFCYSSDVAVTPFNVAALRLAAEWLEMTEDDGCSGSNLLQKTEGYFCRAVAANEEHAATVLRKCLALLPEAEETACLASRCMEVLALADGTDGGNGGWLDDVASISAKDFQMIADSMRARLAQNHDLLYQIVDNYLQNKSGKLTEEEKNRICYTVDCKKLSRRLLIHLVQNQAMPLRFVVQAMLVEQLHTRRSIFDRVRKPRDNSSVSLGAILQRDAALRQVAHLKASMEATSFRIQGLERDLAHMRRRLRESEEKRSAAESAEPARSESLRFFGPEEKVDIERLVSAQKPCIMRNTKGGKSLGKKLIHGFKNVFRTAKLGSESQDSKVGGEGAEHQVVVLESRPPAHRRNHSFT